MSIISVSTIILLFILVYYWRSRRKVPGRLTVTAYKDIRALLDPPATSISALLHRRAIPNARLVHAFGIHDSTFTNPSEAVHRIFTTHVRDRLRAVDTRSREDMKDVIHAAIDLYLPEGSAPGDYATFMQGIVFSIVLVAFFDCTLSSLDPADVQFVTQSINYLWISSKSRHPSTTSPILPHVIRHLQVWIPQDSTKPFLDNPLHILLPIYETLWRLVAHAYGHVEGFPDRAYPFLEFLNNPTPAQFRFSRDSESPSAHDIMQEVLRLHPPTKRIERAAETMDTLPSSWFSRMVSNLINETTSSAYTATVIAADIEVLQRSSVWDPSPHVFDAMRHKVRTEVQHQCFMPFGIGPLKCVAASWAPRFAGMLLAGVATRNDIELIRGERAGGRDGWLGWKIYRKE